MHVPNIIRIFQTIKKLQSAQKFSLEICSGEITRKRTNLFREMYKRKNKTRVVLLACDLLVDLICVCTIYY